MNLYINFFLVLFLSFSFLQSKSFDETIVSSEEIKIWDNQIKRAKNPELRSALEKLRDEYVANRHSIRKDYKIKIEPYTKQKDLDMESLKKEFLSKKESLMEKFEIKPKKLKKNKTQNVIPKAKKPSVIKPSKKKTSKISTDKETENISSKSPVLKKDDNDEKHPIKK